MRTILFFVAMGTLVLLATTRIQAKNSQSASPEITISVATNDEKSISLPAKIDATIEIKQKETPHERFLRIRQEITGKTADAGIDNNIPLGAAPVNPQDSAALVALYNSTNGPGWSNRLFWLIGPVSSWYGVEVNTGGRVEAINLSNNNLVGEIPTEIGNLTALNFLFLNDNQLTGEIPEEFGNIPSLWELYLQNNELTGNIPATLSNPDMFYLLYVQNNNLSGTLPSDMGNIPYLMNVNLSNNQFSGNIPAQMGEGGYLSEFIINNNRFTFKDIEPIFDWSNFSAFSSFFEYSNQAEVGTGDTISINVGEPIRVSIPSYSPGENDAFQWYQDGGLLTGENDSVVVIASSLVTNAGNYICNITNSIASELTLLSKNFRVEIIGGNTVPIANAGIDQTVAEGVLVTLDGSESSDDDNDPLTYAWTAPEGITLSSNTNISPTFTTPEVTSDTDFTFTLVVNDGKEDSAPDMVIITVTYENTVPIANAGIDQTKDEKSLVTLNGSASTDGDGDPLSYLWTPPNGITLSDNTLELPTFTAPEVTQDTTFTFVLKVNDTVIDSEPDTVLITVKQVNKIPVANAGVNQLVDEGDEVTLDGSASSDGDNDILAYEWTAPAGITLSDNTLELPTFTAPEVTQDTTFTFVLTVNDTFIDSETDTVLITVRNIEIAVPETLAVTDTIVETSFTACFDALQSIVVAANGNPVVFGSGSTVDLIAGQRIQFLPGFQANSGSHVHAHISDVFCAPAGAPAQQAISEKGAVIGNEFPNKKLTGTDKSVKIYPNPTNGKITVELTNYDKMAQIDIYNTLGSRVYSTSTIRSVDLNLGHVEKGLYVVRITSDESVQTRKVLKD